MTAQIETRLRGKLDGLVDAWRERAQDAKRRGALGSAVIYLTAVAELETLLDLTHGAATPEPPPDELAVDERREPVTLWRLVDERRAAREWVMRAFPESRPVEFTCDACPHARVCSLAFDPYNTDGDCLADK